MRFELINGDTRLMGKMVNDGWTLVNTFPNPYPQPYFFALMQLNTKTPESYDLKAVMEECRLADIEASKVNGEIPF